MLSSLIDRSASPQFQTQAQRTLGAMCAWRWPEGHELQGVGRKKHLSMAFLLSEFDKTKPQTKW
jgi:hypothetical protein